MIKLNYKTNFKFNAFKEGKWDFIWAERNKLMKKGRLLSLLTVALLLVPYIFILAGVNAKADGIYQYQDKRFIATEEVDISYQYTVNQKENSIYWQIEFTKNAIQSATKLGIQVVDIDEDLVAATNTQFPEESFNRTSNNVNEIGVVEKSANKRKEKTTYQMVFRTQIRRAKPNYRLGIRLLGYRVNENNGQLEEINFHSAGKVLEMEAAPVEKIKIVSLDSFLPKDEAVTTPIHLSQLKVFENGNWQDYKALQKKRVIDEGTELRLEQTLDIKNFLADKTIAQAIGKAENKTAAEGKQIQLSYTFQFGIDKRFKLPENSNTTQPIRLENNDINYGHYKINTAKSDSEEHIWEVTLNQNAFLKEDLILPLVIDTGIDLENDSGSETLLLAKTADYTQKQKIKTTQLSFKIEETTLPNQKLTYDEELGGIPIIWETTITPKKVAEKYAKINSMSLTSEDVTPPYSDDETSSGDGFDFFFTNEKLKKIMKVKQLPLFDIKAYDETGQEVSAPRYELIHDKEKENLSQVQFVEEVASKLVIKTTTLTRKMHAARKVVNRVSGTSKNAGSAVSDKTLVVPEHRLYLVNDGQHEDLFEWRAAYYRNGQSMKTMSTGSIPGVETITLTVDSGNLESSSVKVFDEEGIKGRKVDERLYSVTKIDAKTVEIAFFDFVKNDPQTKLQDGRYYICYDSTERSKQKVTASAVSDKGLLAKATCEKKMAIAVTPLEFSGWQNKLLWQINAQTINAQGNIELAMTLAEGGQNFYFNKSDLPKNYDSAEIENLANKKGILVVATNAAGVTRYLQDDEYELLFHNKKDLVSKTGAWPGKRAGVKITIPQKAKTTAKKITVYLQTNTGGVADIDAMPAKKQNIVLDAAITQDQHSVTTTGTTTIDDERFLQNMDSQAFYNESRNKIDWTYFANTRRYDLKKNQSFTIRLDKERVLKSDRSEYHYFTEKDLAQLRVFQLIPDEDSQATGIYVQANKILLDKSKYHIVKKEPLTQGKEPLYKEVEVVLDESLGCCGLGIEVSSTFDYSVDLSQETASGTYSFNGDFAFEYGGQNFQKSESEYLLRRSQLFCNEGFYDAKDNTISWDILVNAQGRNLEQLVIEGAPDKNQVIDLTSIEVFHPTIIEGKYFPGEKVNNENRMFDVRLNEDTDYQKGFRIDVNRKIDYPLYIRYKAKVNGDSKEVVSKTRVSANEQKTLEVTRNLNLLNSHPATQQKTYTLNVANLVKGPSTPIKNSQFRLEKKTTSGWQTITTALKTNEHGLAVVNDLSAGQYRINEIKVAGFLLNETPYYFTIPFNQASLTTVNADKFLLTGHDEVVDVTIYNELKPFDVTVIYKDHEGRALSGGRMHLSNQNRTISHNLPDLAASETAQFVVKNLSTGIYNLKELRAPIGYQEMGSEIALSIVNTGDVIINGDNTNLDYLGGFVNGKERSFVKLKGGSQNNQIMIEILNHPIAVTKAENRRNREFFSAGIASIFALRNITSVYYVCGTTPIRIVDKKK